MMDSTAAVPSPGLAASARSARRVRGDGLDLAVYESGVAEAPVVVLVHGFPDNHAVWDRVAAVLGQRFHVVAYDVRGAGASEVPAGREGYRLERLAADLEAVIEATGGGRAAHVVGHDWGSIQAWEAVTDSRIARRIKSFTSISGPCLDHAGHWLRDSLSAGGARALLRQSARSWYLGFFQVPWLPDRLSRAFLARSFPRMLARTEGVLDAQHVSGEDAARGLSLYRANTLARVLSPGERATDVPVQVIVPRGDRYVTPALARSAERWAPRLRVREVEGGHWILRSAPREVARWIGEMVSEVESAREAA